MKLVINVDGGSRNNPGPAGYGFVIKDSSGKIIEQRGSFIGEATNNVAEYRGLIEAARRASELGAEDVLFQVDSELLAKQVEGKYRVKAPHLQPLFVELMSLLRKIPSWKVRHVRRELNSEADLLVNQAIDCRGDIS